MAYEKYIKKDGKLYGPYIYHSKRVDGKVISEYHGQKKFEFAKLLWLIPLAALILLAAYFLGQQGNKATGYSILGIDANYQEDKPLEGNLNFLLQQGELVPAESTVIFENQGSRYEYPLVEIASEKIAEGNFFIAGKNLSGFGSGFGLAGTKTISPEVGFVLLIYSRINETENTEAEREVEGGATIGNDFIYELQEGERAELKPRSVLTRGTQLDDGDVSIITNGNLVTVSTQYTEKEQGFGNDYIGEETKNVKIDLSNLNLILQPGELRVSVVYNSKELVSLQTNVGEDSISGEAEIIPEEQPPNLVISENARANLTKTEIEIPIRELELTLEERGALENEFGNISLTATEAKLKNGFMIVRYELGNLWVEYSYSSELSEETLDAFMEADRIKWLKDIAQSLLQPEEPETEINLS